MTRSDLPDYYYKDDIKSRIEEIIPFIIWAIIIMVIFGGLSMLIFGRP